MAAKPRRLQLTVRERVAIRDAREAGLAIKDVADQFGVSKTTVARVMKAARIAAGEPGVRQATAEDNAKSAKFYAEIGEPPGDSLACLGWMHQVIAMSAKEAAMDPTLNPRDRRHELRQISSSLAKLVPYNRLAAAEALVRGDSDDLAGAGAEELAVAPPIAGRIIRGQNQRGRRPNRSKIR